MPVVDCQVHLHNRTYFEAHVNRVEPPRAERISGGYVFHAFDGSVCSIPSSRCEIEDQMERLGAQGIDIVISSLGGFNVDHLPPAKATELAMQLNEEHAELERCYPGRYYGLALLPMQDAQGAIETLDQAIRTLSLRGVCISTNVNRESVAEPAPYPVFRRIEELGIPLFLHPEVGVAEHGVGVHGHENVSGPIDDSSVAALDLIVSSILDRHPTLRVIHPGLGGVLAYLASRIDDENARSSVDARPLEQLRSEHVRRFYTDTASLNPHALRLALEAHGSDHLLYGSDYPHREPARSLELVRGELAGDVLNQVLFENAASLLGLGVRAS